MQAAEISPAPPKGDKVPSMSAASTDDEAPKIFNATAEARGGDIVSVQGANLGSATVVSLDPEGGGATALTIVNRVEDRQISVQLPATLTAPVLLRVENSHGASAPLRLNAARPQQIDATRLVPGGHFRLYGRNLRARDAQPRLSVDGLAAAIDLGASTETVLVATVPAAAKPTDGARIVVDNGDGTGETPLPLLVPVEPGSGDPLDLGVGWGAGFDFVGHAIHAEAACDGATDDAPPIEAAIRQASKEGGGVVLLPAGLCRIAGTIDLASRVVLRGAGQDKTILQYEVNYPVYAEGLDLVGLQDLQLRNAGSVQEGMTWRRNTRSVIQRVTIDMRKSRQWFLTMNRDFVFDRNVIRQSGSYDQQNPYRFDHSAGLVFSRNASLNVAGSPTFQFVHDSVFIQNRFTRDASSQDESPVVAHHQFVVDFAYRVVILDNRFDIANGPVTNTLRNDGETILVEGGGPSRTEHTGVVESAGRNTLTDRASQIDADPFKTGLPWNLGVAIVSGKGAGQARRVTGYRDSTLEVDRDWDVVPEAQSHYVTFVWGLEDVVIAGNTLTDNPRGIWLYSSSINRVWVVGNAISEGGGIYLRSFQNMSQGMFNIQMNTVVADNTVVNTAGRWMSYIMLANVRSDPLAFGIGEVGIEVRRNKIVANRPNKSSLLEEYASREGFVALVNAEGHDGRLGDVPATLAPIFQDNVCEGCEKPYVVTTAVHGASFVNNKPGVSEPNGLDDVRVFENRAAGSSGTFAR